MVNYIVLDENNRVTSGGICVDEVVSQVMTIVDKLPENIGLWSDYLYVDGEFIYDPIPRPESTESENLADMPTTQSLNNGDTDLQNLDSQDTAELLKGVLMELQSLSERLDALESAQIK